MARGIVGADRDLVSSRARSAGAVGAADVALVVGVLMDFRLGFGAVFGPQTELIVADRCEPGREHPGGGRRPLRRPGGHAGWALGGHPTAHEDWIGALRTVETEARAAEAAEFADDRTPLHLMRVLRRTASAARPRRDRRDRRRRLRSYAGRVIDSHVPGHGWTAGRSAAGIGGRYALAAKLARPDRQVVLLQGDGAFGFSGMEWDTLVRHGVHVVSVIGNNGIWALENTRWRCSYGYSVVADLRPGNPLRRGGPGPRRTANWSAHPTSCGRRWRAFESGVPASSTR